MERCKQNGRNVTKTPWFGDVPKVVGRGGGGGGSKYGHEVVPNDRRALKDIKNVVDAPRSFAAGKPGVPEKSVVVEKKNTVAHRPITRSFAATLRTQTDKQDNVPGNENHTKPVMACSNENFMDCSSVIDIDDKYNDDLPLPMVEEVEEAMYEEFREVEMEDLAKEPLPDIDSCDCDNPLAMVEYVDDIYTFFRKMEFSARVSPNYMSNQIDINEKMRSILIDWLIEVHYKFELMDETLFLTVNIIDRFLEQQTVVRKKLQLVGVTAMLLACKYEEVSVPVVEDLILISDRAYTRKEVLDMEILIVNTLKFNMSVPTPYVFMRRFLKATTTNSDKMELLSFFIIELCLVEYGMLRFQPSLLAAAAIYTAQTTLMGMRHWNKCSELHTCYKEEQLLECSRMMVDFHQRAGTGKLTGVYRKYNTFRFGFAAKCEPALFLLEENFVCD